MLQNIVQNTEVKLINKLITQAVIFYSFVQMSGGGGGGGEQNMEGAEGGEDIRTKEEEYG